MWTPLFSVDPMDPRAGRKVPPRVFVIGIAVIIAFVAVAGLVLAWPKEKVEPAVQAEDITAYFEEECFTVYDTRGSLPPRVSDHYAGYLWADGRCDWYIGREEQELDENGGYSYNADEAVSVYFYDQPESAAEAVKGLSADGSELRSEGLSGGKTISIDYNTLRRVYLYENTVIYYEGGDEDVYEALEHLCGAPVADGRNKA